MKVEVELKPQCKVEYLSSTAICGVLMEEAFFFFLPAWMQLLFKLNFYIVIPHYFGFFVLHVILEADG
jgi:hypothetical protein